MILMDDESIFIGGYIIRRTFDSAARAFILTVENTMVCEEMSVAESELTKLLDAFWKKLRR